MKITMDTTGFELNASLCKNEKVTNKRAWVKPEVEMISNDLVKGGPLTGLNELSTISFRHGQMS